MWNARKETMKESEMELTVSQNEAFKSRDCKRRVLIFHNCGDEFLITTTKKIQKRVVTEDENIFHCLFK